MGDKTKTAEQLEQEHHEAAKAEQERLAEVAAEDERRKQTEIDGAQAELDREKEAAEAEQASLGAKHERLSDEELETIENQQVVTGRAPIPPGPEEPVDPDVAQEAKENRGRGLGG